MLKCSQDQDVFKD